MDAHQEAHHTHDHADQQTTQWDATSSRFALSARTSHPGYGFSDRGWIHLITLVCRYWRDVAHATSTLWSHINVGRKAEWLQLCLTRSASTALDIVFTSGEFPFPQLEILLPHARRIRTLRFDIVREEWRAVLRRLLREPMPALEELRYRRIQGMEQTYAPRLEEYVNEGGVSLQARGCHGHVDNSSCSATHRASIRSSA